MKIEYCDVCKKLKNPQFMKDERAFCSCLFGFGDDE